LDMSIDSSVVRAHQHAAGPRKGGDPTGAEALGRSPGGLTTKLHLACEGKGRRLSIMLTPGQRQHNRQLESIVDEMRVPRPDGGGRP
jgi:hypothetical protein